MVASAAIVALTICVGSPRAQASSLVFVKRDGNVWLARPDGRAPRRVTTDGTMSNPYFSPTQSVRGTIEVARGKGARARIYRLSRTGKRLSAPFGAGVAVVDPRISPDGSKVAFSTFTSGSPCYGLYHQTFFCFEVSSSGHFTKLTRPAWMNFEHPVWISDSRLLLFYGSGTLAYADLGETGYRTWFSWLDFFTPSVSGFGQWISGAGSADGKRLALVTHLESGSHFVIQLFSSATDFRSGSLSTGKPALSSCIVSPPDGRNGADPRSTTLPAFDSLSFSPGGDSLAFGYKGAVYVAKIGNVAACHRITVRRVINGASDPNWGPRS